jgi:integrase/recombinase XerD
MASKVNLKKYIAIDGRWRFVPVLKIAGKPRPEAVIIDGETVKGTTGTYYVEWREDGKRIQRPAGSAPREALDAWRTQTAVLDGTIEAPEEDEPLPVSQLSVAAAIDTFLSEVKATKSAATLDAYKTDLAWVKKNLQRSLVGKVTRADIMHLFGAGRDEELHQGSINRRVMVALMALRNAGAVITLKKGDWPKVPKLDVEIYEPQQLSAFFAVCNPTEKLLFQTFLFTGFRMREVATQTWSDIDWQRCTLAVKARPDYRFTPKSYEQRSVPVPASLIESLRRHKKKSTGALVFPTPAHPIRPNYGGDAPDAHHLELCKEIAHRAGLNCRRCETSAGKCSKGPHCGDWYLHRWRHTYATNMLQSGVDIKTLQTLLAHKNLATTEIYLKALRLVDVQVKIESSSLAAYL